MITVDQSTIYKIALAVAKRYKQLCFWPETQDLVQEACTAIVTCAKTFDEDCGVPFERYAWRAAVLAIRNWCWQNTAPVNESWHNAKNLRGVHRTDIKAAFAVDAGVDLEAELDDVRWRARVRDRLMELMEDTKNGDLGAAVLLEEKKAKDFDNPTLVYQATARLKKRIREDYSLYELWRNK